MRYAAVYISIGVALGLYLHATVNARNAEAGRAAPAYPLTTGDTARV